MKPKPVPAPVPSSTPAATSSANPPSTPAPQVTHTPAPPPAPAPASTPAVDTPSTPTPVAPTGATTADDSNWNDPSALTLGAQRDAAITNMESMGFPRAEIDRAMRAAFFTQARAVEYLLTVLLTFFHFQACLDTDDQKGIPESVQQESQSSRGGPTGARSTGATTAPSQPTGNTTTTTDSSADTGETPINLFEAAAQANRAGSGGAGRGARQTSATAATNLLRDGLGAGTRSGAAAGGAGGTTGAGGLGNLDFLRNNPQFQQLRSIVQTQPQMLEPILEQVAAGNPELAQVIGQNPDQFLRLLAEETDADMPLPPGAQEISVTEEERLAIERVIRAALLDF